MLDEEEVGVEEEHEAPAKLTRQIDTERLDRMVRSRNGSIAALENKINEQKITIAEQARSITRLRKMCVQLLNEEF